MKQNFLIAIALILLVTILIGLNAASYVQKEEIPDSEVRPNRSTFNYGATGTRAFYDFLSESGFNVMRWREPVSKLGNFDEKAVGTFVVIGKVRREFKDEEVTKLLNWVSDGGKLVLIGRDPPGDLIVTTANWSLSVTEGEESMSEIEKETLLYSVDPKDQDQMIGNVEAARPIQPTIYTKDVNGIQPSKFATSITFERLKGIDEGEVNKETTSPEEGESNPPEESEESGTAEEPSIVEEMNEESDSEDPGETMRDEASTEEEEEERSMALVAPVAHLANENKTILADFPFGAGQIVFLTDPYIVVNGGINLSDNVQAAINVVGSRPGVIAFDEYHQGYGKNENLVLDYFSTTPLVAIFLQLMAVIALVFFSRSRRFARPVPPKEVSRLSKLEYVSAMAQLQGSTKAFDLAIENIYSDFRRRVSRFVGVDNYSTSREELAMLVAERTGREFKEIDGLMFKCEDITHGEPTKKSEVVELTRKLRELEESLGLARHRRKP